MFRHFQTLRSSHPYLVSALIFLIVLFFYWPLTTFEFVNFDDPHYVTQNPALAQGLTWDSLVWSLTSFEMGHWHPLTWISHAIDVSLFGLDPSGHHLVNLIWFGLGCGILFLILRELNVSIKWSYLAILFFALHPLRLESVAWISERKDVLSFFFGMASLLFYIKSRSAYSYRLWRCGALILFTLSLLAKPTFVSLPVIILAVEIFYYHEKKRLPLALRIVPFATLSALSSLVVILTQKSDGALKSLSIIDRLASMVMSLFIYLAKFMFPFEVAVFYPRQPYDGLQILGAVIVLGASSFLVVWNRKTFPLAWIGWLWFIVAALPLSGLIPIGGQAYADRWTLLPHCGLLLMLIAVLSRMKNAAVATGLCIIATGVMAWLTFSWMPQWKNSESLFRHALQVTSSNFLAHNNLGVELQRQGRYLDAEIHFRRAVELNPFHAESLNNLGVAYARKQLYGQAIVLFQRALSSDPGLVSAINNLKFALSMRSKN
jgi:hypothetical protein